MVNHAEDMSKFTFYPRESTAFFSLVVALDSCREPICVDPDLQSN